MDIFTKMAEEPKTEKIGQKDFAYFHYENGLYFCEREFTGEERNSYYEYFGGGKVSKGTDPKTIKNTNKFYKLMEGLERAQRISMRYFYRYLGKMEKVLEKGVNFDLYTQEQKKFIADTKQRDMYEMLAGNGYDFAADWQMGGSGLYNTMAYIKDLNITREVTDVNGNVFLMPYIMTMGRTNVTALARYRGNLHITKETIDIGFKLLKGAYQLDVAESLTALFKCGELALSQEQVETLYYYYKHQFNNAPEVLQDFCSHFPQTQMSGGQKKVETTKESQPKQKENPQEKIDELFENAQKDLGGKEI